MKSIERLIFAPRGQAKRFFDWLEAECEVDLFDKDHRKIGHLSFEDYAHINICAISLDPFTELSAKAYHLQDLVGQHVEAPFWAVSISDLITYTELFNNPFIFLHFMEKRMEAAASRNLILDDELDHYGLYLKYNDYRIYAEQLGEDKVSWSAFRTVVDEYFNAQMSGEDVSLPCAVMPAIFYEMIDALKHSESRDRRRIASVLLDADGETKNKIAQTVTSTLRNQISEKRSKPFSTTGEIRVTFFCWEEGVTFNPPAPAGVHCKAVMLAAGEPDRFLIQLYFDTRRKLIKVDGMYLKANLIPPAEVASLASYISNLKNERLDNALNNYGKIGANEKCPCGSGKKYKKCCKL